MVIGIMGTPIESSNLGCMALTYSVLLELEQIAKDNHSIFKYIIFDGSDNSEAKEEICKSLNIKSENLISGNMVMLYNPLRILKNWNAYRKMMHQIELCDCIIDITGGDSFSDIYGDVIFYGRTNAKIAVSKMGKPLLLAPQTYGPFLTQKSSNKAREAIKRADYVMTRDVISQSVIKKLTGKDSVCCADLAFLLPFNNDKSIESDKIKIGINVSKLLYTDSHEVSERKFKLKTDYVEFTDRILSNLSLKENTEIYLIPHVRLDNDVHFILKKKYPNLNIVNQMTNPIEMKSIISQMDIFIGARMHGTVAAFTTGVACIPVAYSRKFAGLFKSFGYEPLVDLQELDTDEAIYRTLDYVNNYKNLHKQILECQEDVAKQVDALKNGMSGWITKNICGINVNDPT